MITIKPKITQKLEVDIVTDDGKDINDIIEEICEIAHDRLEMSSMFRQEVEEDGEIESFETILERMEGGFCRILNLLKD